MGILHGTVTVQRFLALGPAPDDEAIMAGLKRERFRPFESGLEEERVGFCDWRNHLLVPAEEGWAFQDRFVVLGLRMDTRKVPPATLKAHVDLRLQRLMAEKDLVRVGKEARLSIQDEVKAELLHKEQPRTKMIEALWDRKAGRVTVMAAGSKPTEILTKLFMKSFGVELQLEAPLLAAERVTQGVRAEALLALDPFNLELEEVPA